MNIKKMRWFQLTLAVSLVLALGAVALAKDSDQWRRRDVSVSDLFEVVQRIQQTASRCGDQLSATGIRFRHSADSETNRVFRRDRRPDDARPIAGQPPERFFISRRCLARMCPSTIFLASLPH